MGTEVPDPLGTEGTEVPDPLGTEGTEVPDPLGTEVPVPIQVSPYRNIKEAGNVVTAVRLYIHEYVNFYATH